MNEEIAAVLYKWNARRAGGRITIYHSAGKVPHIDGIEVIDGHVLATAADGKVYELHL